MDVLEIMKARHSVRRYLDKEIPADIREALEAEVKAVNDESGLKIQVLFDEPACFGGGLMTYGSFHGCANYFSIVGKKGADLDEKAGYFGERLVIKAQELGLNTCWAAMTHGKSKAEIASGEKEAIIIALGYGESQGQAHKSKDPEQVSDYLESSPEWFKRGVEGALLAPTAINQQKFFITHDGNKVTAKVKGIGMCTAIDLGIVKCDFELAAGKENFEWA